MKPWGIMIQTDTHGGDVAAAAADDDYIAFVVFACHKTFFYRLCEIVFAMTTETGSTCCLVFCCGNITCYVC